MKDLIERQDAIDILVGLKEGWIRDITEGLSEILMIPSAEPERVAKILNQSEGVYSAHGVCICGHCENCGNEVCDDFHFCPYCGTELDWSDHE